MWENLARIGMGGDDNKRTRTGYAFATITNPVRRENTGTTPKCTTCNFYHPSEAPCNTCFNCNRLGHLAKDCRVVPRNVNPVNARNPAAARGACFECGGTDHYKSTCPRLNRAQGSGITRPNQSLAIDRGQGCRNNGNQAHGRAFMLGAEEARQDPNIVTGTFTLNNHYAITSFDSGADYSFVSTTFIPLLGIEPSDLGFSYEIEIASGQLVEIDKVIKGYKREIDGHMFDINLIPFGSGSIDVIIGRDWLSNHKAEIICHEKVVRIPLLDGKVLLYATYHSTGSSDMDQVKMDDPNITMEEYIRIEKEKLVVFNDTLTSEATLSCDTTVSSLNDNEIDFRISFDESDDEDYTVIYDKNSFFYKIISVNNLTTNSENDNGKVNMPSLPPPEPTVSCFDDLDLFKDFENEFLVIVYNDVPTSKSDLLTEPILSPQHIDLNDETSFSEFDEEEQNVLYFHDLFPFNVIYSDD
ncbi:putative reverse transcriptase domain-containing protein [Tanacetum coccineum]